MDNKSSDLPTFFSSNQFGISSTPTTNISVYSEEDHDAMIANALTICQPWNSEKYHNLLTDTLLLKTMSWDMKWSCAKTYSPLKHCYHDINGKNMGSSKNKVQDLPWQLDREHSKSTQI